MECADRHGGLDLIDQVFFAPASGTVTVPAGTNSTRFTFTTTLVPEPIVAHISANALATPSVTTTLTINLTNRGKKWVLNNVVFKDGGTASGYFTYDAASGQYLDVNIRTTPGAEPNSPFGESPVNAYYYPWPNGFNPTLLDKSSTGSVLALQDAAGTVPPAWSFLQRNFGQALTNAGGTVPLVIGPNTVFRVLHRRYSSAVYASSGQHCTGGVCAASQSIRRDSRVPMARSRERRSRRGAACKSRYNCECTPTEPCWSPSAAPKMVIYFGP